MKLWIARDFNGGLYLYDSKPEWNGYYFIGNNSGMLISRELFPEVTFENSPQMVEQRFVQRS